jgi:hypothetical protein
MQRGITDRLTKSVDELTVKEKLTKSFDRLTGKDKLTKSADRLTVGSTDNVQIIISPPLEESLSDSCLFIPLDYPVLLPRSTNTTNSLVQLLFALPHITHELPKESQKTMDLVNFITTSQPIPWLNDDNQPLNNFDNQLHTLIDFFKTTRFGWRIHHVKIHVTSGILDALRCNTPLMTTPIPLFLLLQITKPPLLEIAVPFDLDLGCFTSQKGTLYKLHGIVTRADDFITYTRYCSSNEWFRICNDQWRTVDLGQKLSSRGVVVAVYMQAQIPTKIR